MTKETLMFILKRKKPTSNAWVRNNEFYQNNIFNQCIPNFIWVKNIEEFIDYIENNKMPDFISFDFDLKNGRTNVNGPVPNGGDCAKWLVNFCKKNSIPLPRCFSHTANNKQRPLLDNILNLNINESYYKIINLIERMENI